MNAYLSPDKVGARDLARSLTFRGWNDRSCKLANALVGLGLEKGDRIAVLAYNCLEWMEIYAAVAKAALAVVPINFRLIGSEVRYIVENSEAKAIIVQDDLLDRVETIREALARFAADGAIHDIHSVRVRDTAAGEIVNFHCRAAPSMSVIKVHQKVDEIERALRRAFPTVKRVISHAEPPDA